jgi:hypothetical protein
VVRDFLVISFELVVIFVLFLLIKRQQRRNTKYIVDTLVFMNAHNRALTDQDQKWLFESLYSIDKSVRLPEEKAEIKPKAKIAVFKPSDNPMREYKGEKDDWFS